MNEQPFPAQPLPAMIADTWASGHEQHRYADAINHGLPSLQEDINKARRVLADLEHQKVKAEYQRDEHLTNAEIAFAWVEDWCTRHGRNLPPQPGPAQPQPALAPGENAFPVIPAALADPLEPLPHNVADTRVDLNGHIESPAGEEFHPFPPDTGPQEVTPPPGGFQPGGDRD